MGKIINFICPENRYSKVLDSLINPIIKHLPEGCYQKNINRNTNMINVSFFCEDEPHAGCMLISHGIADKNWRNGQRVKDYDYIFVSGESWRQKMLSQGVPDEKILINGYTKLDPLFNDKTKRVREDDKIHVLYAPTHNMDMYTNPEQVSVSCFPRLNKHLLGEPDDITVECSTHPANKCDNKPTMDYRDYDLVVADCGSTLYEAWSLGLPVVFPDWLVKQSIIDGYPNSFEKQIYQEEIGYHVKDQCALWETIRSAYQNGLDKKTIDFIEGIFPCKLRGKSGKTTADMLLELSNKD